MTLAAPTEARPAILRTRQSGPWSAPATWEGGKLPTGSARVQIREVIPVYLHDAFGPGRHAKVVSTSSKDYASDGLRYREDALFSPIVRVAEVSKVDFPKLLDPVDDLPPTTVITHVQRIVGERSVSTRRLVVRGTTADNGPVKKVLVNGKEARPSPPTSPSGKWSCPASRREG
jgi:hypothetical protein